MEKKTLKETMLTMDHSTVGNGSSNNSLMAELKKEGFDLSSFKKIDQEIFAHLHEITLAEKNKELDLQYVALFVMNKRGYDSLFEIMLEDLTLLPKELIENEKFLRSFLYLVIDNTDAKISYAEQYETLPLGLRSNQMVALELFRFLSDSMHSKNIDNFFYGEGVKYVAPKLLRNEEFIKKVMKCNPKIMFGDEFSHVRDHFAKKLFKEICNDRDFLDEMRNDADLENYEGASYIFMHTDPAKVKLEDVLVALKEKNFALLNKEQIKKRFIGVFSVMDGLGKVDCKIDYKNQPFRDGFSLAPKTRLELENLVSYYCQ